MENFYLKYIILPTLPMFLLVLYFGYKLNLPYVIYLSLLVNFLLLLATIILCIKYARLTNKYTDKKFSKALFRLNLLSAFIAIYISQTLRFLIGVVKIYKNDWALNIGDKQGNFINMLDYKLILLMVIPLSTFLISKYVWMKKSEH